MINRSKKGFTLTELVVGISLFTILIVFLSSSIYYLLAEFKNVNFKSQAVFLAQQKLDEYVYCEQEDDDKSINGNFLSPFEQFFYSVDLTEYGDLHKLVIVDVWTGSESIKKNQIQLSGLAYKDSTYTFSLPKDIKPTGLRIYFDPVNNQLIFNEIPAGWSWSDRYSYPIRSSRYDLKGNRLITFHKQGADTNFFGWAYNTKINQLIGVMTLDRLGPPSYQPVGTAFYREKDPSSSADLSGWAITQGKDGQEGYTYWNVMINIKNAVATASDGTTYFVQKAKGDGYYMEGARVWIAEPTEDGLFKTKKTINVSTQSHTPWNSDPKLAWSSDLSKDLGYVPHNLTDIRVDKNDKVILTLNGNDWSTIVETDKNFNNTKVIFPPAFVFKDGNKEYQMTVNHIERDKFGNIYTTPISMYEKESSGSWKQIHGSSWHWSGQMMPIYKFKSTGLDEKGNYVLEYIEKPTKYAAVVDFTLSPDGSKLITIESDSKYPTYATSANTYANVYTIKK